MDRATAINRLKAHEAESPPRRPAPVPVWLDRSWGSAAGFPTPTSLFDVMEIQDVTSRILGCETDTITRNSLHPVLRDRLENAALMVF